jgi:hypothetical protein
MSVGVMQDFKTKGISTGRGRKKRGERKKNKMENGNN